MRRNHRGIYFGIAVAALAISSASFAQAQAPAARDYDVAAQDLKSALRAVAQESGLELLAVSDDLRGKRAPNLKGRYTPDEALAFLLRGTGLSAEINGGTIYIRGRSIARGSADAETGSSDIIVTGSRIRGTPSASSAIVETQEEMKAEGKNSLVDVIRSIPQNFNGGQNAAVSFGVPESNGLNLGSATGFNLRGIGADATLTLLNGHRVAYNVNDNAVDASSIPFNAIDRIEIVADGASALYGSDAVAGVANIILKRDYTGLETTARLGTSTDGGDVQQQYSAIGGRQWGSGGLYAAYEFERATPILARERSYAAARSPGLTLLPSLKHDSAVISGHQDLLPGLTFSIDALYNNRVSERSYALNAAGDYRVSGQIFTYHSSSFIIVPGLKYDPGGDWHLSLTGTYGVDRTHYDGTQYAASAVSSLTSGCYCNTAESVEFAADGPLYQLPAGALKIALGGGYRSNGLHAYRTLGSAQNINVSQE